MARYEAGETLSSIARTYDCSPPAISYVVSRSRARQPGGETPRPAPAGETQLVKAAAADGHGGSGHSDSAATSPAQLFPAAPLVHPPVIERPPEPSPVHSGPTAPQPPAAGDRGFDHRAGNGFDRRVGIAHPPPQAANPFAPSASVPAPRPAAPQPPRDAVPQGPANGDQRARLHLSLGNGSHPNGGSEPGEPRAAERPQPPAPQQARENGSGERPAWAAPAAQRYPSPVGHNHQAPPANPHLSAPAGPPQPNGGQHAAYGRSGAQAEPRKEGNGAFIDSELRARVDGDIAAFLAAFDSALAEDTPESRAALREATDRLLRAGARTRIELERLEARMPLPPRDTGRQAEPAWRQR